MARGQNIFIKKNHKRVQGILTKRHQSSRYRGKDSCIEDENKTSSCIQKLVSLKQRLVEYLIRE